MNRFILKNAKSNLKINLFQIIIISLAVALLVSMGILKETVLNRLDSVSYKMKKNFSASFRSAETYDYETYQKIKNIDTVISTIPILSCEGEVHIQDRIKYFLLSGIESNDINENVISVIEGKKPDKGSNEVIISEKVAKKENLKLGDSVTLVIEDKEVKIIVAGIYRKVMHQMAAYYEMYTDLSFLRETFNTDEVYNSMMISMSDPSVENMKSVFSEIYDLVPSASFENVYDLQKNSERDYNSFSMLLWAILAIFILLSMYMIYSFTIIKTNNASVTILAIKMIGARDSFVKKIYIKENVFVGIAGTILGIILSPFSGRFLCWFYSNGDTADIYPYITNKISYYIISIFIGITVPFLATAMSINGISKKPLVTMMKRDISSERKKITLSKRIVYFVIGVVLLSAVYIISFKFLYIDDELTIYALMVLFGVFAVISIYLMTPFVILFVCIILKVIFNSNKISSFMALKNTFSESNNAHKIVAFISISLMVASALTGMYSSSEKSVGVYVDTAYAHDYIITAEESSRELCEKIEKTFDESGISKDCTWVAVYNYLNDNTKYRAFGVDNEIYDKYCHLYIKGNKKLKFRELDNNSCYVSQQIMIDNGYKIGDKIEIPYNKNIISLTIQGEFSSLVNDGRLIFVNREKLTELIEDDFNNLIFANKNKNIDCDEFEKILKDKCNFTKLDFMWVPKYRQDWIESIFNGTEVFYALFAIVAFFTLLMVIGNYITSVFNRKKDIAVLYYIGANNKIISKEFVIETFIMILLSTLVGFVGSYILLCVFINSFSAIFNAYLSVFFPFDIFCLILAIFVVTLIVINLYVVHKVKKEDKLNYVNSRMI